MCAPLSNQAVITTTDAQSNQPSPSFSLSMPSPPAVHLAPSTVPLQQERDTPSNVDDRLHSIHDDAVKAAVNAATDPGTVLALDMGTCLLLFEVSSVLDRLHGVDCGTKIIRALYTCHRNNISPEHGLLVIRDIESNDTVRWVIQSLLHMCSMLDWTAKQALALCAFAFYKDEVAEALPKRMLMPNPLLFPPEFYMPAVDTIDDVSDSDTSGCESVAGDTAPTKKRKRRVADAPSTHSRVRTK